MSEWTEWTYVCDSGERYRYRQCEGSNPLAYTSDGNGIVTPQRAPQYGGERDCASEYINGLYFYTKQTETRTQPYCNRKCFKSFSKLKQCKIIFGEKFDRTLIDN